ncbi:aspartic proteinase-like protein 1 isoform X2 [Actinidia eriantha]|uniref:aspartic proteinase-like protein 1 isoform X2 n=1 Tax=Actinidia eriantha TaxID=165200 RepID=UPI002590160B|nr:aspartic proteinase-like protein 1 isoform X2 [Actinidia eriantha]XP_057491011.1 aspartic proteinase-like protein 1 isoform X2 [Actinidia eriantha]
MYLFLLHWMLGATYFGFHVTAFNVLRFLPVTITPWCSLVFGASIMQDRDLNEYRPSTSTTSKHLSCSHQLCQLGPNCQSPKQPCPYIVNYFSADTSSSGFLVEDTLHLAGNDDKSNTSVQASVIIGCGRKQSGGYLDGVAPDGLMGLGLGEISVPSVLARGGLVWNSFSLCFDNDDSGRIFFGDQGPAAQHSTPFLPSDGKYVTYIVGVKACCVGSSCLDKTSFEALVDSGTSFTFLPKEAYERVAEEFDRQVNATRTSYEGYPWKYCYKSSSQVMPKTPSLALKFAVNNSFVVHDPVFIIYGNQGVVGFCLAVEPSGESSGTIGQNFMTGYRIVFDRENLNLGWSRSNCQDLSDGTRLPLSPPKGSPQNPLPTTEQQSAPSGNAVAPAVAGRTPSKPSSASTQQLPSPSELCLVMLLLFYFCIHLPHVSDSLS